MGVPEAATHAEVTTREAEIILRPEIERPSRRLQSMAETETGPQAGVSPLRGRWVTGFDAAALYVHDDRNAEGSEPCSGAKTQSFYRHRI